MFVGFDIFLRLLLQFLGLLFLLGLRVVILVPERNGALERRLRGECVDALQIRIAPRGARRSVRLWGRCLFGGFIRGICLLPGKRQRPQRYGDRYDREGTCSKGKKMAQLKPPVILVLNLWFLIMITLFSLDEISIYKLLGELDALEFEQLGVVLDPAIEGHTDLPGTRKNLRVLNRGLIHDVISADGCVTLNH